jgi:uncharacterized protein YydD (DUF2326 family)
MGGSLTQIKSNMQNVKSVMSDAWLKSSSHSPLTRVKARKIRDDTSDEYEHMGPKANSMHREYERVSQLVSINQRINYLARRKAEMQGPIQELRASIRLLKKERAELKPMYENYEFQTYTALEEELDAIR